jgi:hypothetical protein
MTQAAAARRGRVSRSTIARIELAVPWVSIANAVSALSGVGLDLVVNAYPNDRHRIRDVAHLRLINHLRSMAAPSWRVRLEVAAGDHERSADLVLFGADELVHLEVERRAVDYQAQLRSAERKREVLAANNDRPVRLVLAFEDSQRNRLALAEHRQIIAVQLPAASREILRSLRAGTPLGRDGLLWVRPPR